MMYENKNVCEKSVSFVTYNECPFFGYLGQILLEKKYECFCFFSDKAFPIKKRLKIKETKVYSQKQSMASSVGAKRVISQPQVFRNIDPIM